MPPCHGGGHGFESHTHRKKESPNGGSFLWCVWDSYGTFFYFATRKRSFHSLGGPPGPRCMGLVWDLFLFRCRLVVPSKCFSHNWAVWLLHTVAVWKLISITDVPHEQQYKEIGYKLVKEHDAAGYKSG